jgi:hypothetical protein
MNSFKFWLEQQEVPQPKTPLQQVFLNLLSKRYKPNTLVMLAQNRGAGFFDESYMWSQIYDLLYANLRVPSDSKFDKAQNIPHDNNIEQITAQGNSFVHVKDENNWHYRMPLSFSKHPRAAAKVESPEGDHRVSFAAIADPKLIDTLDRYVAQQRLAYYKTPNQEAGWLGRTDPITIYFKEPVTDEVKQELQTMLQPYNRANHIDNPLIGDNWTPGLALDRSPTSDQLQKTLQQIQGINPVLAKVIQEKITKDGRLKASSGQVEAIKQIIDIAKKTNNQPQQSSSQPQPSGRFSITDFATRELGIPKDRLSVNMSQDNQWIFVRDRNSGTSISVSPRESPDMVKQKIRQVFKV